MKNLLTLLIIFISINLFSQNSYSILNSRLTESIYQSLDSMGIEKIDEKNDSCDCFVSFEYKFFLFTSKSIHYDTLSLIEFIDEDIIDEMAITFVNYLKTKIENSSPIEIYIKSDIRQVHDRFNLFRMRRELKFKITIDMYYNLINKK
jgi:hypothetical protein